MGAADLIFDGGGAMRPCLRTTVLFPFLTLFMSVFHCSGSVFRILVEVVSRPQCWRFGGDGSLLRSLSGDVFPLLPSFLPYCCSVWWWWWWWVIADAVV